MTIKRIRSRETRSTNRVNIVMDVQCQKERLLEKEIKKAIRKWNRQLDEKLSYQILLINNAQDSSRLEA